MTPHNPQQKYLINLRQLNLKIQLKNRCQGMEYYGVRAPHLSVKCRSVMSKRNEERPACGHDLSNRFSDVLPLLGTST
jgi:hypothetical protein